MDKETRAYLDKTARTDAEARLLKRTLFRVLCIQGHPLIVEKPYTLQTRFGFGYTDRGPGRTFGEANEQAARSATCAYFEEQNTRGTAEILDTLRGGRDNRYGRGFRVMEPVLVSGQAGTTFLRFAPAGMVNGPGSPVSGRDGSILDFLNLSGHHPPYHLHYLTPEEKQSLIRAYEDLLADTLSRCRRYWKRYGGHHIETDVFWADR